MNDKVISEINNLIVTIQAIINDLHGRNDLHLICEDTIEQLEEFKDHIQELDKDTNNEKC